MIREEAMKKNLELFKQVREDMQAKKGFAIWHSQAYMQAKKLLDKRKNGISITISVE